MNKFISILFASFMLASYVKAEPYYITDPDALLYNLNRTITDPTTRLRLHQFCRGLKSANLWTNIVHGALLRPEYNAISGSTFNALVGTAGTVTGSPILTRNGLYFDGTGNNYIQFPNPLPAPATAYSFVVGLEATNTGAYAFVIGGADWGGNLRGPQLFVHGNTQNGSVPFWISQWHSTDGVTAPAGYTTPAPGYYATRATSHGRSLIFSTFSATQVTAQQELGGRDANGQRFFTTGSFGTAYNGRANYTLGRNETTTTAAYQGTISCYFIYNRALAQQEIEAFRRIYMQTVGIDDLYRPEFIWEGDSLVAGAQAENPFWLQLKWAAAAGTPLHDVTSVCMAKGGDGLTAFESDFATQAAPYAEDTDYTRVYYGLLGYGNDIVGGTADTDAIFKRIQTLWARAKALNFKVIAFTYPVSVFQLANPAINQQRLSINAKIRQSFGYDYLIDVANLPGLQDPTQQGAADGFNGSTSNTKPFQTDGLHLTNYGHALIAAEVRRVITNP